MNADPTVRIVSPWTGADEIGVEPTSVPDRPCVLVAEVDDEAFTDLCHDALPHLGAHLANDGKLWQKFELPAAALTQLDATPTEPAHVDFFQGDRRRRVVVELPNDLPRRPNDAEVIAQETGDVVSDSESASVDHQGCAEALIDRHLDLVNHLNEAHRPHRYYWEGNVSGTAVRSVQRVLAAWKRTGSRDEPRMALIVRLARQLPTVVESICLRPRRLLRRERLLQSVDRIQEVDAGCLRWLVRQPGLSLTEKAGNRQQLLGIARVEDVDTPENRLVRDFLLRAGAASRRYLKEHQQFQNKARVEAVRRFYRLVERLRQHSPLSGLPALAGSVQPNYVLQYDVRYRKIWDAWLSLVRQQQEQDQAWRWRHRIFAEQVLMLCLETLKSLSINCPALRSDLHLRTEQVTGCFLDPSGGVGSWCLPKGDEICEVDLLWGAQVDLHPLVPNEFKKLRPDILLLRRASNNKLKALFALWSALSFSRRPSSHKELEPLREMLDRAAGDFDVHGAVVRPCADALTATRDETSGRLRSRGLTLPLSTTGSGLTELVRWGLRL